MAVDVTFVHQFGYCNKCPFVIFSAARKVVVITAGKIRKRVYFDSHLQNLEKRVKIQWWRVNQNGMRAGKTGLVVRGMTLRKHARALDGNGGA